MIKGFDKIKIKGSGISLPPGTKKLNISCNPYDYVFWVMEGTVKHGILKEWDDNIAVVKTKDTEIRVQT